MFDNLSENNSKEISKDLTDKPGVVEDIFLDQKPEVDGKTEKHISHDLGINSVEIEQQSKRKLMVLLLMFIGLIAIGLGTYFAFGKIVKKISNIDKTENESNNVLVEEETTIDNEAEKNEEIVKDDIEPNNDNQTQVVEDEIKEEEKKDLDFDKDGLSDEEEIALGTNIKSADTDSDGLFDREEVKIYKTDPLNPDTDRDGFLDGEEVKAGYNPIGEGRILNINRNQN